MGINAFTNCFKAGDSVGGVDELIPGQHKKKLCTDRLVDIFILKLNNPHCFLHSFLPPWYTQDLLWVQRMEWLSVYEIRDSTVESFLSK